jgi:hypothetical protein
MRIAYMNYFSVRLRDRHSSVTLSVFGADALAGHALWGIKGSFEHLCCDGLARIGTTVLTTLVGTTGLAENAG